jgi:ABC-type Fe3+-hydroxamate transport system substrate-binding protein
MIGIAVNKEENAKKIIAEAIQKKTKVTKKRQIKVFFYLNG